MIGRLPVRIRLTLVFAGAMAFVLLATGLFVYVRVGRSLNHSVDRDLASHIEDVEALAARSQRPDNEAMGEGEGTLAQVLDGSGHVVRTTPPLGTRPLLSPVEVRQALKGRLTLERHSLPGLPNGHWRLLALPVLAQGRPRVAVVASSLQSREETLRHLLVELALGGLGALLLASLAGYALATAALRPVEAMSRKAAEISLKGDDQRLPVPRTRDEIAHLGERLNEMLARIEAAMRHERRFLADASHELRTPLTVLKAELELALRRTRTRAELEQVLRSAKEETDRLAELAEDLLVIARADQGALPVRMAPTPARKILSEVADRFDSQARGHNRRIVVSAPGELRLHCDPARVEQALGNLVANALHHGGGEITIVAREQNGLVELHVSDRGKGFPPGFLPRAFERFSRVEEGRAGGGTGLGLAIVEAIAQAHGGSAVAENRPDGGSDVWFTVPREQG
ncbi:MAG: HAMP domain-containing sensor histidine kinase [Gaiellaceae bacterium]